MPALQPISTPLSVRLRHWRLRMAPIIVWLAAVALAVYLGQGHFRAQAPLVGIVEIREAPVASPSHGRLTSLEVSLYQEVAAGTIVARMDDQVLLAEIATARAELALRRSDLAARRQELLWEDRRLQSDTLSDLRRLALDEEEAHLDVLDREAALQVSRVELEGLETRLQRLDSLLESGIIDPATHEEVFYLAKTTEARIAENEAALRAARSLLESSRSRRTVLEESLGSQGREIADWLAPMEEALAVQETLLRGIDSRRELLTLRAPVSGRVTSILAFAGQTVLAGAPIMIITSSSADRIIAYAKEQQLNEVAVGMEIELETRREPRQVVRSRIAAISSKVEEMPLRLSPHPLFPQWGLPLLVEDIAGLDLFPGEVLDIRILPVQTP